MTPTRTVLLEQVRSIWVPRSSVWVACVGWGVWTGAYEVQGGMVTAGLGATMALTTARYVQEPFELHVTLIICCVSV